MRLTARDALLYASALVAAPSIGAGCNAILGIEEPGASSTVAGTAGSSTATGASGSAGSGGMASGSGGQGSTATGTGGGAMCPPCVHPTSDCQSATGSCSDQGVCIYPPLAPGSPCDMGVSTCDGTGVCRSIPAAGKATGLSCGAPSECASVCCCKSPILSEGTCLSAAACSSGPMQACL